MVQEVIVYGAGLTGIGIAEWIRQEHTTKYKVVGFIDDYKKEHNYPVPILGNFEELKKIKNDGLDNIILGFVFPVEVRLRKGLELLDLGFKLPSLYPPEVKDKWGVSIGRGVLIYNNATVNPNVKLGDLVGINAYSNIESSEISEGVIITQHVSIGSKSYVGKGTIIYPGARILPNVKIGEFCHIGPNAVVNKDLKDKTKYLRNIKCL